MRNGVTLAVLREEVEIEAGISSDAGHSPFSAKRLNQMLNRTERRLAQTLDWPALHIEQSVPVPANTQFINMPSQLNFTMIDAVHVAYGSDYLPVQHGIHASHRATYDETQRASPISRWEVVAPGREQFEVWPIGSQDQTLLFEGTQTFGAMVEDTDTCALDADVLVLAVAAEILGRDQKEDAKLKLDMAMDLADTIIKRQGATKREPINLARRSPGRIPRPGIDYIPPGG